MDNFSLVLMMCIKYNHSLDKCVVQYFGMISSSNRDCCFIAVKAINFKWIICILSRWWWYCVFDSWKVWTWCRQTRVTRRWSRKRVREIRSSTSEPRSVSGHTFYQRLFLLLLLFLLFMLLLWLCQKLSSDPGRRTGAEKLCTVPSCTIF